MSDTKPKEELGQNQFTMNRFLLKVKYSFYSTLVFFIFANPETFRIVHGLLGKVTPIITSSGVPTPAGFFIHAFGFFATMLGLMMLPSE
jgi:hypothetical protein